MCVALYLGFSKVVPSVGGLLGSRGEGEGAEAEEPAVSKGGKLTCAVNRALLEIRSGNVWKSRCCGGIHKFGPWKTLKRDLEESS